MKPLNVPDRSMSDAAEVSVKPCGGDTACEVLPLPVGNGNRLCDVQGLKAGRRHWLGGMAAAPLGGGALAAGPGVVRAAARATSERKTVSRSQATLPFPMSRAVPGGVAVVSLGAARRAPKAIWNGVPVLVTGSSSGWFAVLGIPLHTLQDRLVLEVRDTVPGATWAGNQASMRDKGKARDVDHGDGWGWQGSVRGVIDRAATDRCTHPPPSVCRAASEGGAGAGHAQQGGAVPPSA